MNNLEDKKILDVENQYWVDMNNSLERLKSNKDFQKVVLQGYFKDKAINGVSLLASDHTIREGKRPAIIEALIAISHLEDYFITIEGIGSVQEDDFEDSEQEY